MDIQSTIKKTAKLSRLYYNEQDSKKFESEFTSIINYISVLDELDLENVEPLAQLTETNTYLRPDKLEKGLSSKEALRNAPKANESFFKVPKVIDRTAEH